jgi:hypothetical protein
LHGKHKRMIRDPDQCRPSEQGGGRSQALSRVLFALWLISFCLVFARPWCSGLLASTGFIPEGLLLVLTAAATLTSLMWQSPGQTVLLAAIGIGSLGFGLQALGSLAGTPTGLLQPSRGPASKWGLGVALGAALMWIVVILNSRGVAQMVLRRRRRSAVYGLWLLGLSVALAVILAASVYVFVARLTQPHDGLGNALSRAELMALGQRVLCWTVVALFTLAWIAVILINKKSDAPKPSVQPLFIWLLSSGLLWSGQRAEALKWTAGLWLVLCGLVAALACRSGAGGD